jgi:hypothetical protein
MELNKEQFAWYAGLILGTSGLFIVLGAIGIESYWPKLITAAVGGMGMGWLFENQLKQIEMRSKE